MERIVGREPVAGSKGRREGRWDAGEMGGPGVRGEGGAGWSLDGCDGGQPREVLCGVVRRAEDPEGRGRTGEGADRGVVFLKGGIYMVEKEKLHLGQEVRWKGETGRVDALTGDRVGVDLGAGGYVVVGYSEVDYVEEEG